MIYPAVLIMLMKRITSWIQMILKTVQKDLKNWALEKEHLEGRKLFAVRLFYFLHKEKLLLLLKNTSYISILRFHKLGFLQTKSRKIQTRKYQTKSLHSYYIRVCHSESQILEDSSPRFLGRYQRAQWILQKSDRAKKSKSKSPFGHWRLEW